MLEWPFSKSEQTFRQLQQIQEFELLEKGRADQRVVLDLELFQKRNLEHPERCPPRYKNRFLVDSPSSPSIFTPPQGTAISTLRVHSRNQHISRRR